MNDDTILDDLTTEPEELMEELQEELGLADAEAPKGSRFQEKVGARLGDFGASTRDRYQDSVEGLREGYDRVSERMIGATDTLDGYIRVYPARSLALAALIGFIIGFLFHREDD